MSSQDGGGSPRQTPADYERVIADHLQALAAVAGLVLDAAELVEPVVHGGPDELAPVDAIDADVRERMRDGEPRTGYDFGDPTFPVCPHPWCEEQWHGLAITRRMREMRQCGEMDRDYRYTDDDSEVLCPGSLFEGEFVPPEPQPAVLRPMEQMLRAALANRHAHLVVSPVRQRPHLSHVRSLADVVLAPPDPGMPWWRCNRYLQLWLDASQQHPVLPLDPGDGELTVRALLNTGSPLEFKSFAGGGDRRPWGVAVRWLEPPPGEYWQRWVPGPLICGETFTGLTGISRVAAVSEEMPAGHLSHVRREVKERFVRDVLAELHVDIDVDDVVLNRSEVSRHTLMWTYEALWRPRTDVIELLGGDRPGYVAREPVARDVVVLGAQPGVEGTAYGRAGWNADTRRWVYMPIDPAAADA